MNGENKNEKEILTTEIGKYIERGFGSMNKNDFEVWIFHWLLVNNENCIGKSDFAISQFLKIPESKVKRLRYEAGLKHETKTVEEYKEELKKAMRNAKCQEGADEGKITMCIPDKILRQYLSDMLVGDGRFMDSSFNSSIVSMSAGNFVYVIEHLFLEKKEKENIISEAKKHIEKGKKMPQTVVESLSEVGVLFGKSLLEKIVGSSADKIVDIFKEAIEKCKK